MSIIKMKVSIKTIIEIRKLINGDSRDHESWFFEDRLNYRSGPSIYSFFNELGFDDEYNSGGGVSSRRDITQSKLAELNDKEEISLVLKKLLNPQEFIGREDALNKIISHLNKYLSFDGYSISIQNKSIQIYDTKTQIIQTKELSKLSSEYINSQSAKVESKITQGDYDGAISDAFSLIQSTLKQVYESKTGLTYASGSLKNDFQKVGPLISSIQDSSTKPILSALVSLIGGLDELCNDMGTRHTRPIKPNKHHAILCVNAVKMICEFIIPSINIA